MVNEQRKRTIIDMIISVVVASYYWIVEPVRLRLARMKQKGVYETEHEPLVSIMMPTFKRGKLLIERTLPSILNQTYQNFEVIIVGDRTLDDTEILVKNLGDPRVTFHHLPEYTKYPKDVKSRWFVGGTPPRNKGLSLARGTWIAELDDDDIFTPDHIEVLLSHAQLHDLEFVSAAYEVERHGKREIINVPDLKPRIGGIQTWLYRSYLTLFRYNIHCWRKSYNCPQEIDRQIRMYRAGVKMGFLDKVVTYVLPVPGLDTTGLEARRNLDATGNSPFSDTL